MNLSSLIICFIIAVFLYGNRIQIGPFRPCPQHRMPLYDCSVFQRSNFDFEKVFEDFQEDFQRCQGS